MQLDIDDPMTKKKLGNNKTLTMRTQIERMSLEQQRTTEIEDKIQYQNKDKISNENLVQVS